MSKLKFIWLAFNVSDISFQSPNCGRKLIGLRPLMTSKCGPSSQRRPVIHEDNWKCVFCFYNWFILNISSSSIGELRLANCVDFNFHNSSNCVPILFSKHRQQPATNFNLKLGICFGLSLSRCGNNGRRSALGHSLHQYSTNTVLYCTD